jgi:hypothetical protein
MNLRCTFEPGTAQSLRASVPHLAYLTLLIHLAVSTLNCALPRDCAAQTPAPRIKSTQSLSGQFVSQDRRPRGSPSDLALSLSTNKHFVCLDPTLAAVSCERIKKYLNDQLGAGSAWRGKIYVTLHGAEYPDESIVVTSERFQDLWQYRVNLPDVTERAKYVRAIVQVLLLEMANRSGPARSAELPLWLLEGLARQLLASNELEIVLTPPDRKANGIALTSAYFDSRRQDSLHSQRDDPLGLARTVLRANPFFTFDQLSWPLPDQLVGEQKELYSCSAQVFVTELLKTKDGKSSMLGMLGELPNYYNWQLAFLSGFRSSFGSLLDVEKWWTLRWVNFTGTDATYTWRLQESWEKLDQSLRASIELRADTNQLPLHSEATLQTIIRQWEDDPQRTELQRRLDQIELLRLRVDPRVRPFLDDYRRVIETFLKESHPTGVTALLRKQAAIKNAQDQAAKQLDLLDARRRAAAGSQSQPITTAKSDSAQ